MLRIIKKFFGSILKRRNPKNAMSEKKEMEMQTKNKTRNGNIYIITNNINYK